MNSSPAELIARAVLYEGYILYPYRPSAIKNRQRWTFGGLAPASSLRAECLVRGDAKTIVAVTLRFLHLFERTRDGAPPWLEATEREVSVAAIGLVDLPREVAFAIRGQRTIEGFIAVTAERIGERLFRLSVRVRNNVAPSEAELSQDELAMRTLTSAHVALRVCGGEFASLTDPPEDLRSHADACRNEGVWPVLIGEPGSHDAMLASPIILPDYPRIAPESTGDFYDGTEIDEMLALRVLTLTDGEKKEMAEGDSRAKAILERVEVLSEDRMRRLHGAVRTEIARPGDRVRLRPRGRADAFDLLLNEKLATIISVEVDFEGTTYFSVTLDDDPGGDLGATGQVGHRFFFRPDEVERV